MVQLLVCCEPAMRVWIKTKQAENRKGVKSWQQLSFKRGPNERYAQLWGSMYGPKAVSLPTMKRTFPGPQTSIETPRLQVSRVDRSPDARHERSSFPSKVSTTCAE